MVSQEQRRKQLAREKRIRQQQRRAAAQRRARQRTILIGAALGLLLVVAGGLWVGGVFDSDSGGSSAEDPCGKPAAGKVKPLSFTKEPALTIDKSADYTMELDTTCGSIGIALEAKAAPHTVNSFRFLAGKGYFDHTRCHRLTTGTVNVLQCGDPRGDGEGDPGYTLDDENLKDKRLRGGVYPAGTVAMANKYNAQTGKGRDSGGSQFFLVYRDTQLPPDYTPFGTVSKSGMKVLKKIADAGEDSGGGDGAPNATVVIDKATVRTS
ncbi:putative peptidyl-prolyl cis-trans isomerase [Streptomyces albus]|uniref:Putative peptidyl-prolyl cis-trans isomerase n=1 Tax=Streptomyces albus (strain ATCC 21838 / DSM 41398 / FERM P-419 / JCM 4703 / NBRC 107858) TaxID=1081613 RepID=A0A0B5F7I5_STRA4|nr:putative peptidyl-prolyl cis-trans isomerase [Streptomyces albus]AOU81110.1 putative peptidyl-prolyl cis-trans isomerase [Streptomyces albus]AYN36808.1 peptidylprolyl isomerase [Streptomyces albus]